MRITEITILGSLLLLSLPAAAEVTVRDFSGEGNTTTAAFLVDAPWVIDWQLFGDYDQLLALDITLINADTGFSAGRVLHTKYKGSGVRMFDVSGRYQLRISSTLARWRIKVKQLTEEEAALYTPRETGMGIDGR